MHVCVHIYIYIYVYVYICIYTFIYIYIHTCIYIDKNNCTCASIGRVSMKIVCAHTFKTREGCLLCICMYVFACVYTHLYKYKQRRTRKRTSWSPTPRQRWLPSSVRNWHKLSRKRRLIMRLSCSKQPRRYTTPIAQALAIERSAVGF